MPTGDPKLTDVKQDQGDFELCSPCRHLELPQTLLEPILLQYATPHGFAARFGNCLVNFDDIADDGIVADI